MESKYYVYLISSLPMLHFGARPPSSFARFLAMCERLIPESDLAALRALDLAAEGHVSSCCPALRKWHEFDMALRNELVKVRAGRRHLEASKYLREDGYAQPHLYQIALQAYRNPSLLDGERALDQERWHFLDGILQGHYFDLDVLAVYGLKLLMLEKWEKIRAADGAALVEEALSA